MFRNLSILTAMAAIISLQACSNEPSCNFEGKWQVTTADLKTEKISPSIVNMAKEEYLSTEYEFLPEGKLRIHKKIENGDPITTEAGWAFDEATQQISWSNPETTPNHINEAYQLTTCSAESITLTQRMPADPEKEELVTVTLTLSRAGL